MMKNLPFKNSSSFADKKNRLVFSENEIFSSTTAILKQSKFSNKLLYSLFKQNQKYSYFSALRNRCVLSGYSRSVISRSKLSRVAFSKKILQGSMVGFYRAI
jgi:ribosomal protein S14